MSRVVSFSESDSEKGLQKNCKAKIVKNGLLRAKQKAKPDHELYRTIKVDPRPSEK